MTQWCFPTSSADLDGALARDMTTLDVELERARALLAVSVNGYELKNLSEQLRADRSVVLAAVRQCGEVLRFANDDFVQDSVVVLAAVLQNPSALRFAARQFEGVEHIVLAAVRQDPYVIELADPEVIESAFRLDPEVLLHALVEVVEVLAAPQVVGGCVSICDGSSRDAPTFLDSCGQRLLDKLGFAVADWVQRRITSGDEEAAQRHQDRRRRVTNLFTSAAPTAATGGRQERFPWTWYTCAEYAGWATSCLDRRRALMVLYRSHPFNRRTGLAARVLEFL